MKCGKSVMNTTLCLVVEPLYDARIPMAIPAIPPRGPESGFPLAAAEYSRRRPAPRAKRTAISRVRERARLRRSPATLVQATSRTARARITKITPNFQFSSSSRVRISNWVYTAAPRLRLSFAIFALEIFREHGELHCAPAAASWPVSTARFTCNSRSSRSSKKFFCRLVENTRAIASGM